MSEHEFTEDMGEISGFGDDYWDYEQACRDMVTAAAEWLEDRPDADISVQEIRNVFGAANPASDDAEELERVMVEACKESHGEGPSGAMMHACFKSALYVHEHGWKGYVDHMEGGE